MRQALIGAFGITAAALWGTLKWESVKAQADRDEVLTPIGPGWGGSSNPSPASLALAAALAQAYLAPEDCWVRPLFAIHHP